MSVYGFHRDDTVVISEIVERGIDHWSKSPSCAFVPVLSLDLSLSSVSLAIKSTWEIGVRPLSFSFPLPGSLSLAYSGERYLARRPIRGPCGCNEGLYFEYRLNFIDSTVYRRPGRRWFEDYVISLRILLITYHTTNKSDDCCHSTLCMNIVCLVEQRGRVRKTY